MTSINGKTINNALTRANKNEIVLWGREFVNEAKTLYSGAGSGIANLEIEVPSLSNNNDVKIGIFSITINTTGSGIRSVNIASDVMENFAYLDATNNGFASYNLVTIPLKNKIKLNGNNLSGISSCGLFFWGCM